MGTPSQSERLPIHAVLPELREALRYGTSAVLVAPPGAGKTTAVGPSLLGENWCRGQIIITSPRRVAARAAAERMAAQMGEKPGETVGYLTRMDSRQSPRTRILIVTEAIFVNRLTDDPELSGISAVLFDEAHERHLDSDLGLALALESQSVLREDLRLLVMSATIDGARFAELLGAQTPVIASEGKAYPLEIVWLGGFAGGRVEDAVASAVREAWRSEEGDILAFLPGAGEIRCTYERLEAALPGAVILPLHGQVSPAEQRAAIRRDPEGRRRIVLASAIAESSVTLDRVRVVVDSGLARRAEFDPAGGTTHLVTHRASQASAAQRAGRAARQAPGVAYRLWEEAGHSGRPAFDPPEVANADLAPLVLALAQWGTQDARTLAWLDPPPTAAMAAARTRLERLGALDAKGRITPLGEQIAAMPMAPEHGAMVLSAARHGAEAARSAAHLVLLLQERGLGGRSEDLAVRQRRWDTDYGVRATSARGLAKRWAEQALEIASSTGSADIGTAARNPEQEAGLALARARPDFVARRRDAGGERWLSAGGRGFVLDPASPLAASEWLEIGDAQGSAGGARITAALALSGEEIETALAEHITTERILHWNADKFRVEPRMERRLGAITLTSGPDPAPDEQAIVDMLVEKSVERLGEMLPPALLARARFAGIDALSADTLGATAEQWLAPLLTGRRDLAISQQRAGEAALAMLDWDSQQRLDAQAPRHFVTPAGTRHAIDYSGDDAPSVEVRVQAMFGLDRHPMIGPRGSETPLLIKLTSPAGRPVQATRDLPGFWRGSWADVRKDMKGRYPKHRWPEQPWAEKPSLKTKNAFSVGQS